MPYPESCPECGGAFRNTGTHYTARRNEVGRHVLLELGCQNTSRRYWWDFTSGTSAEDGTTPGRRASLSASAGESILLDSAGESSLSAASMPTNGSVHHETVGRGNLATLDPPAIPMTNGHHDAEDEPTPKPEIAMPLNSVAPEIEHTVAPEIEPLASLSFDLPKPEPNLLEQPAVPSGVTPAMKEAFVRQLQLDRLTLRQMRSWLMADEARRAIEVAAGATEATYERLALILFGVDLPQLLGKQPAPPPNPGMSAEERLELQREKARIRARLRRAAAKAARQPG
jgi:hypothetical protein